MKLKYLFLLTLTSLFLFSACQDKTKKMAEAQKMPKTTPSESPNTLSAKEKADGWMSLFDGSSLEQWKAYNKDVLPESGWTMKDGVLVGHGGGDLITKEAYENFDLKLDFQLTEAANSGIFYLAQEIEGTPIYHSAPEYQLLDNATYIEKQGMDIMKKHLTADNYDIHDGIINPGITHGKWHEARIVINNGHVEHWLNGKKHVEYELNSPEWIELVQASKFAKWPYAKTTKGHIGLQDHGNEVRFRNIRIKKL